jgi:hypothetical protein
VAGGTGNDNGKGKDNDELRGSSFRMTAVEFMMKA